MAASAAKRPRPALEAGASADAAWFQANVMRRDDAVAWWRLPHFPKLAAGAWVRVVGKPSGYELMRVQKVLVAHKPYALPVPGGEPVPCTALLMVRSFLKGELKPRTLAQLSNSPPTREEAEALLSALAREGAAAEHRAAEGSPGKLYPAMATAAPIDGAEPEATAARAVRQFLGGEARGDELAAGVTAEAIAAAVVEHRELVGRLGTPAFEARQAVPVRQASPDALVAIASAGAVADVKRPVAPFGRAFGGATHFFVVDIDALVRSGAVAEGWGRRPFGGIAALDRMRSAVSAQGRGAEALAACGADPDGGAEAPGSRKRPRDSGGSSDGPGRQPARSSAAATGVFDGSLALVPEGCVRSALPRSAVSHPFPPRSILAADEEEAVAVTAAVPAAVAVISRRQARGLNPGDWPSLLQAGSGPPSPSAHANAAGSDPARGPGGGADAPDSEAEHDGRPVFAADSRPADAASYRGVPFLPILGHALAAWRGSATTVVLPRSGSTVRLFHGTAPSLALAVLAGGFKRPACRFNPPCKRAAQVAAEAGAAGKALAVPRGCECQMMGFGVYLARRAKAFSYAARRAEPLPSGAAGGGNVGAVIECEVDLGCTHHAIAETCACGCGRVFSDHHGIWYSRRGCDSVFLDDGSMPATATAEWAVADPARVRPVSVVLFRTDA